MTSRLVGLDLARTLALLAMIATHTLPLRDQLADTPTWVGLLFGGRASVLFAMLAGAALVLMAQKSLAYLWTRSALLILFGVVLELLGTPVLIILGPLGLTMALVAPLRRLPFQVLGLLAMLWLLVMPWVQWWLALNVLNQLELPYAWDAYPLLIWTGYTLTGAAVMAWVHQRSMTRRPRTLMLTALVAGAGAAVLWLLGWTTVLNQPEPWQARLMVGSYPRMIPEASGGIPFTTLEGYQWLLTPHSAAPAAVWQHALVALAVILVALAATQWLQRHSQNPVLTLLSGPGRWSLTTYCSHIVLVAVLMVLDPTGQLLPALGKAVINYTLVLVLALVATKAGRGPLESVVAKIATTVAGTFSERGASSSGPEPGPPPHRKQ